MIRFMATGACAVGALAACSSPPAPREQLAVGKASVEAAQTAGAAELAPVELNMARDKLGQATLAMHDKKYIEARRLAEQADVDAQVARSKATAERSRKAAEEVSASLRTLRQQLDKANNDSGMMPVAPAAGPQGTSGTSGNMPGPSTAPGSPSSPMPVTPQVFPPEKR
jgi:hypothetical protein